MYLYTPWIWSLWIISLVRGSTLDLIIDDESHTCQVLGGPLKVNSPDDVATKLKDCHAVDGSILLVDDYSGPFILPNVTSISGSIQVGEHRRTEAGRAQVTAIETPELHELGSLKVLRIATMTHVSMPKLTTADAISWVQLTNDTVSVELQSLRELRFLNLDAELSRVNLESLRTVEELYILGAGRHGADSGSSFDLLLPELDSASTLGVFGRFSSVSIPKLREVKKSLTVGCEPTWPECPASPGYTLELPQLSHLATEISVYGPITSLSMPSLQETQALVKIGSSAGLNLSLPLVRAGPIDLDGRVESINFPNLVDLESICMKASPDIDFDFDCEAFIKQWKSFVPESPHDLSVSCSGHHSEQPPRYLSILLSLAVIFPIVLIALLVAMGLGMVVNAWKNGSLTLGREQEIGYEEVARDDLSLPPDEDGQRVDPAPPLYSPHREECD